MNRWTTWIALLFTSALPLVGCGGSGACDTMTVTVTVVNTDDDPLPAAAVSFQGGQGQEAVECPQLDGNTFECEVPTDGDYNVYAELEDHNGAAQRVTPDCEADEAPSVELRMDTRIGGV